MTAGTGVVQASAADDRVNEADLAKVIAKYENEEGFETMTFGGLSMGLVKLIANATASEEDKKPRYTDALHGIALIYEIIGDIEKAAATYDRWIACLKDEWVFADDDRAVVDTVREKNRVLGKK